MAVRRIPKFLFIILVLVYTIIPNGLKPSKLSAGALSPIQIELSNNIPSQQSIYKLSLTPSSTSILESIRLEFCQEGPIPNTACTLPIGMDINSASLVNQIGNTGFVISSSAGSNIQLNRTPAPASQVQSTYQLANIVNPSSKLRSIYLRVYTYANSTATGTVNDYGSAIFSTEGGIGVGGYVPPYLKFCVGQTVDINCQNSNIFGADFGKLSPNKVATATSQLAGSTNDESGYSVFVGGTTLASGTNYIANLGVATESKLSESQFGFNLVANTNPNIGIPVLGNGTLSIQNDYNIVNKFKFNSGDMIARSLLPTESNLVTLSYIANISSLQNPGVYSTSINFIATASF